MAVGKALIAAGDGFDPEDFSRRLVEWLPIGRGKGKATTAAVTALANGVPWHGYGRDPVFMLDDQELGPRLRYRPDPDRRDRHGFIEPARPMTFGAYQQALWSTRKRWRKVWPQ